jgi:hypothetical protein
LPAVEQQTGALAGPGSFLPVAFSEETGFMSAYRNSNWIARNSLAGRACDLKVALKK